MSSDHHRGAKRHGHERAQSRNLTNHFDIGEKLEVVIEEPPSENGGDEAVASISEGEARDVIVFITPGSYHVHRGDHVRCRIKHVDHDFLKAVCIWKLR